MSDTSVQVGSSVYVTAFGPFMGLRGTVQSVDAIPPLDESYCFCLVKLERVHIEEPVWFHCDEVEVIVGQVLDSSNTV